jgi:hypothetical protein
VHRPPLRRLRSRFQYSYNFTRFLLDSVYAGLAPSYPCVDSRPCMMPGPDSDSSGYSPGQGSPVTRLRRSDTAERRKCPPSPAHAISSQTVLQSQTQNELVPLPWMGDVTIMLEDVVNFAKERQETYYSRLQSTSFLAFVDLAQVLLQFATAPKTAQHIKSNSSCSIVSIIGEHGAGKTI